MMSAARALLSVLLVASTTLAGNSSTENAAPFEGDSGYWTDGQSIRVHDSEAPTRRVLWRPATLVEGPVNTLVDEYEPKISPDGATLVFVRRRPGENADLFASRWIAGHWSEPAPIPSLEGGAHDELGPEFSADGLHLYFYSDRPGGEGGYDLWSVERAADGWSAPVNLGSAVNSPHHEYGPALQPNGRTLVFASNRPRQPEIAVQPTAEPWSATMRDRRSRHDYDLYATDRSQQEALSESEWSPPRALSELNTEFDEGTPAFSPGGDFLYFASDRAGGSGGFDLYRTRWNTAHPLIAESLGDAVNSDANDLDPALSAEGFRLHFSSDRRPSDAAYSPSRTPHSDYGLWVSVSREVWPEAAPSTVATSPAAWLGRILDALWPWLALLLALLTLLALAGLFLRGRDWRQQFQRLGLLARCLVVSLLVHALLVSLFTIWVVGNQVGQLLDRSGGWSGSRVVLAVADAPALAAAQFAVPDSSDATLESVASITLPAASAPSPVGTPALAATPLQPAFLSQAMGKIAAPSLPAMHLTPHQVPSALPVVMHDINDRSPVYPIAPQPSPSSLESPLDAPSVAAPPLFLDTPSRPETTKLTPAERSIDPVAPELPTFNANRLASTDVAPSSTQSLEALTMHDTPTQVDRSLRIEVPKPAASNEAEVKQELVLVSGERSFRSGIHPASVPNIASTLHAVSIDALPPLGRDALRPTPLEALTVRSVAPPVDARDALAGGHAMPNAPQHRAEVALPAAPAHDLAPEPALPAMSLVSEQPNSSLSLPDPHLAMDATPIATISSDLRPMSELPAATHDRPALDAPALASVIAPRPASLHPPAIERAPTRTARLPDAPPGPAPMPRESFAQRDSATRDELLEAMGGSEATEQAVAKALEWLRRHQAPDGRWSARAHEAEVDADLAMTGLALLSFLGAGHTHSADGPYRETVEQSLVWIVARQRSDGDLRHPGRDARQANAASETMYGHTIATVALCEAFAMTRDPRLAQPAIRAVNFVTERLRQAQRTRAATEDTSVLGWLVMTVESARRAGLQPSGELLSAARTWLDAVEERAAPGRYAHRPGEPSNAAMTAEAMFVRQLLGHRPEEARMRGSAEFLLETPPSWDHGAPTYYWYYATLALFQQQGEAWQRWNDGLVRELLAHQRDDGESAGSWDPHDPWSKLGGRVYQTAVCTLSLEVYYRYRVARDGRESVSRSTLRIE